MLVRKGSFANVYELGKKYVKKVSIVPLIHYTFVREWMVLAGLNHPNVITLHGVDVVDNKLAVILERLKYTLQRKKNLIKKKQIAGLMYQLLSAVAYIHKKGLIHGDLNTSNVMIRPGVKIIDFGLTIVSITAYGVLYTINYRAPEILEGEGV